MSHGILLIFVKNPSYDYLYTWGCLEVNWIQEFRKQGSVTKIWVGFTTL